MTEEKGPEAEVPPHGPPHRVTFPLNIHRWETISFLHWPFDPAHLAPLLPKRLTPQTWDGTAWVGVTPFLIRVRPPLSPIFPPGWTFPETNLRTYVRGPDSEEGIWFLRAEVSARWFMLTLRPLGFPYHRNRMSVDNDGERIIYRSRPSSPTSSGGHNVVVVPGQPLVPPHGTAWDRFLTARWNAFHSPGRFLLRTPVEHPPWRLQRADVIQADVAALFDAAGLPQPLGEPVSHFSPGVEVKVGVPRPSGDGRAD